jgi:hypothetical protein
MYITRVLSLLFTYLLLSNAAPLFFRDDPNRDRPALEERRIQKRNEFFNIEFLDISNTEAGVVAMSNNDEVLVARAFRMAIALANAAVGIQPDNPLYSIFFHDVSNYNEVMGKREPPTVVVYRTEWLIDIQTTSAEWPLLVIPTTKTRSLSSG